ncbi:MAG: hypothetical protein HQ463_02165 [Bacteroidetes bacterium]|nr:hypothetical protein [Bacteroidota bacterium]
MAVINKADIKSGFGDNIEVISETSELVEKISDFKSNVLAQPRVLLLMSSGNFDNATLW